MAEPAPIHSPLSRVLERAARVAVIDDAEVQRRRAEAARDLREDRLFTSGISERLDARGARALARDDLDDSRALRVVRGWLGSRWAMLVLLGEVGLGKTVAAGWALTQRVGRYVVAEDLCEMRRGGWRERELFRRHMRTELLVVDELGRERDHGEAIEVLQEIVDRRQQPSRRTILMGNLSVRELVERYDERTIDRLGVRHGEAGGCAVVRHLQGRSLRGGPRG